MTRLYRELLKRFPEIREAIEEEAESPYVLMIELARWLADCGKNGFSPETVERVAAFTKWCEEQPRGETAGDDLYTILVVGFYEHLFESEFTRPLLPHVVPEEDVVANAGYLIAWVGKENYNKALEQYGRSPMVERQG